MGWAVILLPDRRGEDSARRIWNAVYAQGICAMLFEGDNRPHISLMLLETQDGTLEDAAKRFAAEARPVSTTLSGISTFGEDVIYLSPEPSAELYEMNRKLTGMLGPLQALADPHYLPGEWRPHMTMAFKIPEGDFARAMAAVKRNFAPFPATFGSIAVVKFNPVKIVGVYPLNPHPPAPSPSGLGEGDK